MLVDTEEKLSLRRLLNRKESRVSLTFDQLSYLYEIDKSMIKEVICRNEGLKAHWKEINEIARFDVAFFEELFLNYHK